MKPLYEDLWVSTPEFPAEDTNDDTMLHGFMLKHPRGNLLIGRVENPLDHEVLAEAGGIIRHYLTHWHEAGPGTEILHQRFNNALYCHIRSLGLVNQVTEPDVTLHDKTLHFNNFYVIPTPGHTPDSCSFMYCSPGGHTYLFTGDTLTRDRNRWVTLYGIESQPTMLKQTLDFYRSLRPDVILMSSTRAHLSWRKVTLTEWLAAIDEVEQLPRTQQPV